MTAIVGNLLAKSKESMYDLFMEFDAMLFYIAVCVCIPLTLAIDGFIDIYYEHEIATSFLIAFSFGLVLFSFVVKQCTTMFVNAAGLYKETKKAAIVDASVNLVLSLTLVHFIGISGVVLATAISVFIAEYAMKSMVIHKHVFEKSSKHYFVNNIKFFILYFVDLGVGYYIIHSLNINNLLMWFFVFIVYTLINALVMLLVFRLFNETKFIGRFKILFSRGAK